MKQGKNTIVSYEIYTLYKKHHRRKCMQELRIFNEYCVHMID